MSDTDTHRQQMFRETKKDKHSSVQMIWCRLPAIWSNSILNPQTWLKPSSRL